MADALTHRDFVELRPGLAMVPVVHGLQTYADAVRAAVFQFQPTTLAVELPRALSGDVAQLVEGLPRVSLLAWKSPEGRALFIPGDPCDPLIEAARLAAEFGLELECVDTLEGAVGEERATIPDSFAVSRLGAAAVAEEYLKAAGGAPPGPRTRAIAARLNVLSAQPGRVLFIGSLTNLQALQALLGAGARAIDEPEAEDAPADARILPVSHENLSLAMIEMPAVAWLYETFRSSHGPEDRFPTLEALRTLLKRAARGYQREYDEEISNTEWRALTQYARNLALVRGSLRPRLFELLTAAKGCVNDDFGAIFLEECQKYPPNAEEEERRPRGDSDAARHRSLCLHGDLGCGVEKLECAYPQPGLTEVEWSFRRRKPTRRQRASWQAKFALDQFLGSGICSWPPEDDFIERFFRTVRARALQQIGDRHSTVEEFSTSVLDGLDVRETLRNWHRETLYVRRDRQPPGKVGPVVMVWRDFPLATPDLWRTCLYAEHQNESDLAMYSSEPGKEMVGPGITRVEYHGLLSVFPAAQIPDVWRARELYAFGTCARLLIAAAILLSEERFVAVVAPQPPDPLLHALAREQKRALIYLPMGTFSKALLKRARQCHILSGHKVRGYAGDYIPEL